MYNMSISIFHNFCTHTHVHEHGTMVSTGDQWGETHCARTSVESHLVTDEQPGANRDKDKTDDEAAPKVHI